jgi:hypothetical protein
MNNNAKLKNLIMNNLVSQKEGLLQSIITLINDTRRNVAVTVNSELTTLYWHIGKRINESILKNEKADYGKTIIKELSVELTHLYGSGFSETNLYNCVKFNELFSDTQILHSLSGKLTWTHIRNLIYIEDELKREFYIQLCIHERWSVRALQNVSTVCCLNVLPSAKSLRKRQGENHPIGLILCSEKSPEQIK